MALVAAKWAITDKQHIADEQRKNREARAFIRTFFGTMPEMKRAVEVFRTVLAEQTAQSR
ncbi:MAG: hypothetical protein V4550_11025 [Gemmatimonadota bacterium]